MFVNVGHRNGRQLATVKNMTEVDVYQVSVCGGRIRMRRPRISRDRSFMAVQSCGVRVFSNDLPWTNEKYSI